MAHLLIARTGSGQNILYPVITLANLLDQPIERSEIHTAPRIRYVGKRADRVNGIPVSTAFFGDKLLCLALVKDL
jgi:hypothetical protein